MEGFCITSTCSLLLDAPQRSFMPLGRLLHPGVLHTTLSAWILALRRAAAQAAEVRTGNLGFGNKGAVTVRFRLYDEPMCIVCAHLASGQAPGDELRRRCDILQIAEQSRFGVVGGGDGESPASGHASPRCALASA
jgi:hypothetical protein